MAKANSSLIENIQSPNGMDGVWMSALRGNDSNSQTPRNNTLQEETVGLGSKAEETKKQSLPPSTPEQMMPSPSKRSGGPRSGGKLDRLRRTYSLSLEAARKMRALKNLQPFVMENESLEQYMFQGSELLDREQAKNLYFCIPMRTREASIIARL